MNLPINRIVGSKAAMLVLTLATLTAIACGGKEPPVARPAPPPPANTTDSAANTTRPPAPPDPVSEPLPVPPEPAPSIASASLDDINKNSPFKPVFFALDSTEISPEAQAALAENAQTMKRNPTWAVTIEGHCDERGSAEYNLALGERRAVTVRAYLVTLGIPAERLRTVSYGKEFPFDPGRDEAAMAKNRRAHFVITAQ